MVDLEALYAEAWEIFTVQDPSWPDLIMSKFLCRPSNVHER